MGLGVVSKNPSTVVAEELGIARVDVIANDESAGRY